jgi:hypothetical protein
MKSPWVSDRVIWVATECSRPVIVGSGPVLLPNHTVYIQLWNQEVLQSIEVHVTRNFSPGEKEWSVDLCSAYSTEKKHLRTVSYMFNNFVLILRSQEDYIMAIHLPC